jgi:hypothetical protein
VDAFVQIRALRILVLGTGIVGALPLLFAVTPGFTGPPLVWTAGLFSLAVSLLSQAVLSVFLSQPFFGSSVTAAGIAILLAIFCVWLGRLLWRAIRSYGQVAFDAVAEPQASLSRRSEALRPLHQLASQAAGARHQAAVELR